MKFGRSGFLYRATRGVRLDQETNDAQDRPMVL
jgi:hypothetical protein